MWTPNLSVGRMWTPNLSVGRMWTPETIRLCEDPGLNIPRGPLWGFKDFVEYFRLPGIWRTYSHTYFTCKRYLQRLKRPEYATIYCLIILNKRLFVFYYIIIILLNVLARHTFLNFFFPPTSLHHIIRWLLPFLCDLSMALPINKAISITKH